MEHGTYDIELNELIRSSMDIADQPSSELNHRLKASLYQREAVLRRQTPAKAISLWYIPMILNFITFGLLAITALLVITNPYLSKFAAAACLYAGLAGILITFIGMNRTGIKEEMTIYFQKRGVIA